MTPEELAKAASVLGCIESDLNHADVRGERNGALLSIAARVEEALKDRHKLLFALKHLHNAVHGGGFPHEAIKEADAAIAYVEGAESIAHDPSELDMALSALTMRANDLRALDEDIEKLKRVARCAISASVTVMNDLARTKLLEAIEALPMRLRRT